MAVTSIGLSLTLDLVFCEFPSRIHPVALFGRLVSVFDRSWSQPRPVGTVVAFVRPFGAAALVGAITAFSVRYQPILGTVVAALALFTTTSLRMLLSVATDVITQTESDPDRARESVRALVGRDASELSPGELRSAAVRSSGVRRPSVLPPERASVRRSERAFARSMPNEMSSGPSRTQNTASLLTSVRQYSRRERTETVRGKHNDC